MHQYEARALKLKPKSTPMTRLVKVKVQPNHEVKTLKPEYVWPERRAVDYPTEYKPKPHPREIEMVAFRSIRSYK
jgi:hypothetical protein